MSICPRLAPSLAELLASEFRTTANPVYFVSHHLRRRWPEIASEDACVPLASVPASRWGPGENIWIVSTYLRLRAAGIDVRIVDRVRPGCINLYHEWEAAASPGSHQGFLVFTQGDRDDHPWADLTLSQSPQMVVDSKHLLIDMWPQPGLVGRDASRGTRVERIGYVGPLENLAAPFLTDEFRASLGAIGVELVIRDDPNQWHNFSDLDLYLAVRDWPRHLIRTKPATKLVHAWLTGVPGLLGPEPSFQYWGSNGLDYFEVRTPEHVLGVIKRLKCDPALYESIRQRGYAKGREHDERAVLRQWTQLLEGPVQQAFERWRQAGTLTWKWRALKRQWHRRIAPLQQKWFTLRSRGWRALERRMRGSGQR